MLQPGAWDLSQSTVLAYSFNAGYAARYLQLVPLVEPDLLIAGALGAHVRLPLRPATATATAGRLRGATTEGLRGRQA